MHLLGEIVPLTLFPSCLLFLAPLTISNVSLSVFYFCRLIEKPTPIFGCFRRVHLAQSNNQFHYRHATFFSQLKSKVGNILAKVAALRFNLNIYAESIVSRSHTHPSHSQTSLLLTSSLSLDDPRPPFNPVYARRLDTSVLAFSLSLQRHPLICIENMYSL